MKINFKNVFNKKNVKLLIIEYLAILFFIAIDITTKIVLENYFENGGSDITLIPNVLSLTYAKNTGAAFSMFSNSTLVLTIFSVLFLIIIICYDIFSVHKNWWHISSFALIIAGGVGNLVDRATLGFVRDFIRLDFVEFAIFNIADMFLTVGIIAYSVYVLFFYPKMAVKE